MTLSFSVKVYLGMQDEFQRNRTMKWNQIIGRPHCVVVFNLDDVFVSTERSGGHVDQFDIVERVEMGQMASMFFNKGNIPAGLKLPLSLPIIQLTADTTIISHV